jgi:tRNA threonylcarbamoyladenosine biosynthesis protein TsaE
VATVVVMTGSVEETEALGAALGAVLRPGDVVGLHGQLGAGKTALVRGMTRGMGIDGAAVSSPTFVVAHRYEGAGKGGAPGAVLWHVDAYRLTGEDELESIGWDRVMDGSGAVAVEWAERIGGSLPHADSGNRADVRLEAVGESARRITIEAPDAWAERPQWPALAAMSQKPASGRTHPCPVCGEPVSETNPSFPFSSERCRMADLGKWLSGRYVVSRDLTEEDINDPDVSA